MGAVSLEIEATMLKQLRNVLRDMEIRRRGVGGLNDL